MKPSAKSLMWLAGTMSALSIALQFVDLFLPFRILTIVVLVLTAVIGALAIWQWYTGDRELRQQFQQERREREMQDQRLYDLTPKGRLERNLEQLRAPYNNTKG
jgi:protein-S-isoprenylcysteine O-methyltransferase Ste14